MNSKDRTIKAREIWLKCYEELGSASMAARKCGIPRSTLYRWIKRTKIEGNEALKGRSRRPITHAKQKVTDEITELIKSIRTQFNFGPQRISLHLLRVHNLEISAPTVWRVMKSNNLPNIKKYRKHGDVKRYNRPIPGDRVQIDDCTRLRVLRLYGNKKTESTIDFLGHILDTFEFPIHRIQTDWGTEFFNDLFQEELMDHFIKFRPIKPRSPH